MIARKDSTSTTESFEKIIHQFKQPDQIYLSLISFIGIILLSCSLYLFEFNSMQGLLLFGLLAALSAIGTTSVPELTFEIGSAISVASIPLYGPFGAILVATCGAVGTWFAVKNTGYSKASFGQVLFNISVQTIAVGIVGALHHKLAPFNLLSPIYYLPLLWLLLSIIHDQINFWLVMIMIRLQVGSSFNLSQTWINTRWAMSLNILLIWLGGGLLAFSSVTFGLTGILAYFVPLGLSAYAFRLYLNKMKGYMDNLEQIVSERTEELQQLVSEKDAFLAMLTHDMKTPLTTIGLYAQMLESRPDTLSRKPHIATSISRSQKTLLDLVNNILDVEHLEAGGGIKLEKEFFDISALAESIFESLEAVAAKKKTKLKLNIQNPEIIIHGDESQLKRVITNLVSNGIKYSPEESEVCINLSTSNETVLLEIEDNGYGIPEEDLPYIFDKYQRVESHKNKAVGTGLGLAIVKAIVEAHAGVITVESQLNEGSQFKLELPKQS